METDKFNFDIHFQNGILKQMLREDMFALGCSTHIKSEYFSNKYQAWLFKKIKMYMEKYKAIPTKNFLVDQLKTISVDELESYKLALKNILEVETKDIDYMKDELTNFIRSKEFAKMHKDLAELYNDKKLDEAMRVAQERSENLFKISFSDDTYVTPTEIDVILTTASVTAKDRIPTGIPLLDDKLGGGLAKEEVTTIISAYNAGKTTAAINIAYYAAMSNKKVLFLFHEGNKKNIVLKFLARITCIPYNRLVAGGLTEGEYKKIDSAKLLVEKYIRIKEMRKVGIAIEEVYSYAKATKKEWDFDLLIDDYGAILSSSSMKFKEKRHVLTHIWETFSLMSSELKIAIVTIAQFNREAVKVNREGSKVLRSENVSEAIGISQHSDNIITLNRSSEDALKNNVTLCLDKTRETEAGLLIECVTDFKTSRVWDPNLGIKDKGWDG